MQTYLNKSGKPIMRCCGNCKFFKKVRTDDNGYCLMMPMIFAFTGKQTVYAMTKTFYYCQPHHEFENEAILKASATPVEFNDYKPKDQL